MISVEVALLGSVQGEEWLKLLEDVVGEPEVLMRFLSGKHGFELSSVFRKAV